MLLKLINRVHKVKAAAVCRKKVFKHDETISAAAQTCEKVQLMQLPLKRLQATAGRSQ